MNVEKIQEDTTVKPAVMLRERTRAQDIVVAKVSGPYVYSRGPIFFEMLAMTEAQL